MAQVNFTPDLVILINFDSQAVVEEHIVQPKPIPIKNVLEIQAIYLFLVEVRIGTAVFDRVSDVMGEENAICEPAIVSPYQNVLVVSSR